MGLDINLEGTDERFEKNPYYGFLIIMCIGIMGISMFHTRSIGNWEKRYDYKSRNCDSTIGAISYNCNQDLKTAYIDQKATNDKLSALLEKIVESKSKSK